MSTNRLGAWLRWLTGAATVVFIAGQCLAVAVLVIALVPHSPVTVDLPAAALTGLEHLAGVTDGAAVDRAGHVLFRIADPSLAQRLLSLAMVLPGLLLVVEIARRLRHLLRAAQVSDPFRADTAHALTLVAKVTAVGGVAVWAVGQASQGLLAASVLTSPVPFRPQESPLGWLAVALILAGFGQLLGRGVAMRAELDTVI